MQTLTLAEIRNGTGFKPGATFAHAEDFATLANALRAVLESVHVADGGRTASAARIEARDTLVRFGFAPDNASHWTVRP